MNVSQSACLIALAQELTAEEKQKQELLKEVAACKTLGEKARVVCTNLKATGIDDQEAGQRRQNTPVRTTCLQHYLD